MPRPIHLVAVALVAAAGALVLSAPAPAATRLLPAGPLTIAVVDGAGAQEVAPAAVGSGVDPASRDARVFLSHISAGAPAGTVTAAAPGRPGLLADRLGAAGIVAEATGPLGRLLVFGDEAPRGSRSTAAPMLRVVDDVAEGAGIVIGIPPSGRTPLDVRVATGEWAVLSGGQSRRPGIVTPYDLTATILAHFDAADAAGVVGRPVAAAPNADAVSMLRNVNARMLRDTTFMQSLTAWTVVFGLGFGWLVAWIAAWRTRPGLSARLTAASSTVTAGFLIGLFVPSARGDIRAIPMLILFTLTALAPIRDRETFAMRMFLIAGAATAALAVIAAADPGSGVAAALWGNPLVSWRLFGLQNFAAAFIAGGVVVAATRLGLRALPLALLAVAMMVVAGSPRIGANFVAVLTFAFGATFAVAATARSRLRPSHIALAAGAAVAAFGLALLADAGNATSHGGAAARQIGRGGVAALWDLSFERLRLNLRAIGAFPGGWAWVVLFLFLYGAMIRDAFRFEVWPLARRAAVAAGALAGLAALALEDSGFKTTAVLGFPALMLWTFARCGPDAGPDTAPDTAPDAGPDTAPAPGGGETASPPV